MAIGIDAIRSRFDSIQGRVASGTKEGAKVVHHAANAVRSSTLEVFRRAREAVKSRVPVPCVPDQIKSPGPRVLAVLRRAERKVFDALWLPDHLAASAAERLNAPALAKRFEKSVEANLRRFGSRARSSVLDARRAIFKAPWSVDKHADRTAEEQRSASSRMSGIDSPKQEVRKTVTWAKNNGQPIPLRSDVDSAAPSSYPYELVTEIYKAIELFGAGSEINSLGAMAGDAAGTPRSNAMSGQSGTSDVLDFSDIDRLLAEITPIPDDDVRADDLEAPSGQAIPTSGEASANGSAAPTR